jgi:hypothetical protein
MDQFDNVERFERFENVVRAYFADKKISDLTLEVLQGACRYDIDRYIVEMAFVLWNRNLKDCNARIHQEKVLNKLRDYNGESDILPIKDSLNLLFNVVNVFGIRNPGKIKGVNHEIPDYKGRISGLLKETLIRVEREIGIPCEIHVQPYGVDSQAMITVGDVEHRRDIKRIIVTCINDKYKSLDGEYLSIDDLKLRVKELEESKKNEHIHISISKYNIYESGWGSFSVAEPVCLIRYI